MEGCDVHVSLLSTMRHAQVLKGESPLRVFYRMMGLNSQQNSDMVNTLSVQYLVAFAVAGAEDVDALR